MSPVTTSCADIALLCWQTTSNCWLAPGGWYNAIETGPGIVRKRWVMLNTKVLGSFSILTTSQRYGFTAQRMPLPVDTIGLYGTGLWLTHASSILSKPR